MAHILGVWLIVVERFNFFISMLVKLAIGHNEQSVRNSRLVRVFGKIEFQTIGFSVRLETTGTGKNVDTAEKSMGFAAKRVILLASVGTPYVVGFQDLIHAFLLLKGEQ